MKSKDSNKIPKKTPTKMKKNKKEIKNKLIQLRSDELCVCPPDIKDIVGNTEDGFMCRTCEKAVVLFDPDYQSKVH